MNGLQSNSQVLLPYKYRFAFNGQEKTDEISGVGNHTTALYWEYDTRLGRRWNLDPVPQIGISDYAVMGLNPILNIDPNGDYFFGLFGSTSEQRRTAKDAAAATGGDVKNITSKNISVEYSTYRYSQRSGSIATGVSIDLIEEKHTLNFLQGGGIDLGDATLNREARWAYESSLPFGAYNIYTGYPKGSGALAYATIDPIDLFSGMLTGGLISSSSKAAITEGVTNRGIANFSETTIKNMNNPKRYVPATFLDDVAKNTKGVPDPQGVPGLTMHYSPMLKNGDSYNLEVLFNESINMITHFKYTTKAIGNLPATK